MGAYVEELRRIKSVLIVTVLQKRQDLEAAKLLKAFKAKLNWGPLVELGIGPDAWDVVINQLRYDPKSVFCHPAVLKYNPITSLYCRGISGLSLKAAREYCGAIESLEAGRAGARLSDEKALKMARIYNTFISSIIKNTTAWNIEDGLRTIIATLGITVDGMMRNRIGAIAEERVRSLVLEWLIDHGSIVDPPLTKEDIQKRIPQVCKLPKGIIMRFGAEPDISFEEGDSILAVVEIKGGIDPAGALERYGAATKSFQQAIRKTPRCKNCYLVGVITKELEKRIRSDRLVEMVFNIIEIIEKKGVREKFFNEVFHHTLRIV